MGPRLFRIYVNDLPEIPSRGYFKMFANDTTFYCSGDSVDGVCANIQSLLEEIVKWCPTIHPDKTEVMLLTHINFIGPLRPINFVTHSHSLGQIPRKPAILNFCRQTQGKVGKHTLLDENYALNTKKLFTRPDFEFLTVKLQLKITDPNTGQNCFPLLKLVLNPNIFLNQLTINNSLEKSTN